MKFNFNLYALTFFLAVSGFIFTVQLSAVELKQAVKLYKGGQYSEAAVQFHELTSSASQSEESLAQANYYLGLSLYKLKLYQASTFPLVKAIRSRSVKYKNKALKKLIFITNNLDNQTMLDFAIADFDVRDLGSVAPETYYYKLALVNYEKNKIDLTIENLLEVIKLKPNNEAALNLLAISYLKKNDTQNAIQIYQKITILFSNQDQSSVKKSYSHLNLARAYFQSKKYKEAIESYTQVSQMSAAYRESLTEIGWSNLHLGRPQVALGSVQTLHTSFYENYFDPESLFLRAVLLNLICQTSEAESVIKIFNSNYRFILEILTNWTDQPVDVNAVMVEIEYATEVIKNENTSRKYKVGLIKDYNGKIPFKVTRTLLKDSRLRLVYEALVKINEESILAQKHFSGKSDNLKIFLSKIYEGRTNFYKEQVGQVFNQLLKSVQKKLAYYNEQLIFVNYEIIETKKNVFKQKTLSDQSDTKAVQKSKDTARLSEGLQVWPFQGEYWQDEAGSYQYNGENLCVQ